MPVMTEGAAGSGRAVAEEDAVAKAHAIYTPLGLALYDVVVHGVSNHLAWRCPTRRLLALYERNLSANHLEAGAGTGYFLDKTGDGRIERLALLDINLNALARATRRLARFTPSAHRANLLARIDAAGLARYDSIGLTYVLHCLPGRMREKLRALDHLRRFMNEDAVLFGATILGREIAPNPAARGLLALYNKKGVFNNRDDDFDSLETGLKRRFDYVEIERQGCVALFKAR